MCAGVPSAASSRWARIQRRGAVERVRLADRLGDLDLAVRAHDLLDELHREQRRQVVRADGLAGPGWSGGGGGTGRSAAMLYQARGMRSSVRTNLVCYSATAVLLRGATGAGPLPGAASAGSGASGIAGAAAATARVDGTRGCRPASTHARSTPTDHARPPRARGGQRRRTGRTLKPRRSRPRASSSTSGGSRPWITPRHSRSVGNASRSRSRLGTSRLRPQQPATERQDTRRTTQRRSRPRLMAPAATAGSRVPSASARVSVAMASPRGSRAAIPGLGGRYPDTRPPPRWPAAPDTMAYGRHEATGPASARAPGPRG